MTPRVLGLAILILVGGAFGVVGASAATLGGLKTADLGAATAATAMHTSGITATWTPALSGTTWVLNGITLSTPGTDRFAAGEQVRLTIIDPSGAQVCELTTTNANVSASLAITRTAINAACGSTGIAFSRIDRVAIAATHP